MARVPKRRHARYHKDWHITARGHARWNTKLFSTDLMEKASPDARLADNSLVPAFEHCSVDHSDSPDLGASLFVGNKGLQRQSSSATHSFDDGSPKSCFPHRRLHEGLFHAFIRKVVPGSSCTNWQDMPVPVCAHLIGLRDRHLSKLQWMTLSPMTRQAVSPLQTPSGAVLEPQWDRVGHIPSSDSSRRPVGQEEEETAMSHFLDTHRRRAWSITGRNTTTPLTARPSRCLRSETPIYTLLRALSSDLSEARARTLARGNSLETGGPEIWRWQRRGHVWPRWCIAWSSE